MKWKNFSQRNKRIAKLSVGVAKRSLCENTSWTTFLNRFAENSPVYVFLTFCEIKRTKLYLSSSCVHKNILSIYRALIRWLDRKLTRANFSVTNYTSVWCLVVISCLGRWGLLIFATILDNFITIPKKNLNWYWTHLKTLKPTVPSLYKLGNNLGTFRKSEVVFNIAWSVE